MPGNIQFRSRKNKRQAEESVEFSQEQGTQRTSTFCKNNVNAGTFVAQEKEETGCEIC